jgi:glycosyltransferase involved in cell wall biosynthesis
MDVRTFIVTLEKPKERGAFVVPSYNPGALLGEVLAQLEAARAAHPELRHAPILVVDDGCTDDSCSALPPHVELVRHQTNLGKGAALQTAFHWAKSRGLDFVVTLDADNQHPVEEAVKLYLTLPPPDALLLAVRDMKAAGAPLPNRLSNAFSNRVLSLFGGARLFDTQCGLRRYPIDKTLALGASHPGYAFESELVLRAARTGMQIVHIPSKVRYPLESERVSHFHALRDPAKNVLRVVKTAWTVPHHRPLRRWGRRFLLVLVALGAAWLCLVLPGSA